MSSINKEKIIEEIQNSIVNSEKVTSIETWSNSGTCEEMIETVNLDENRTTIKKDNDSYEVLSKGLCQTRIIDADSNEIEQERDITIDAIISIEPDGTIYVNDIVY